MKPDIKKMAVIFCLPVVAVMLNLYIVDMLLSWHDQRFYPSNLVLAGVSLAGMSREEALEAWPARARGTWGDSLVLKGPEKAFTIPLAQWDIKYDTEASLQKADRLIGREREKKALYHVIMRGEKQELTPVFKWNEKELQLKVVALTLKEIKPKEPENAALYWDEKQGLKCKAEKYGYKADPVETYKNLASQLKAGIIDDIEIKTVKLEPRIKKEQIKAIDTLLNIEAFRGEAAYPSWYEMLDAVNGRVVMPGDSWQLLKEIDDLKVSKYVLKSDKEILLKGLLKAWQGAGLAGDGYNLVNNSRGPAGITLSTEDDNIIVVRVWGTDNLGKKKVILQQEKKVVKPPVTVKLDEKLAPGEKRVKNGISGEVTYNYKVVFNEGIMTEKVLLWQETKKARATVVYYGRGTAINK